MTDLRKLLIIDAEAMLDHATLTERGRDVLTKLLAAYKEQVEKEPVLRSLNADFHYPDELPNKQQPEQVPALKSLNVDFHPDGPLEGPVNQQFMGRLTENVSLTNFDTTGALAKIAISIAHRTTRSDLVNMIHDGLVKLKWERPDETTHNFTLAFNVDEIINSPSAKDPGLRFAFYILKCGRIRWRWEGTPTVEKEIQTDHPVIDLLLPPPTPETVLFSFPIDLRACKDRADVLAHIKSGVRHSSDWSGEKADAFVAHFAFKFHTPDLCRRSERHENDIIIYALKTMRDDVFDSTYHWRPRK